jgi:hypothetical protein
MVEGGETGASTSGRDSGCMIGAGVSSTTGCGSGIGSGFVAQADNINAVIVTRVSVRGKFVIVRPFSRLFVEHRLKLQVKARLVKL